MPPVVAAGPAPNCAVRTGLPSSIATSGMGLPRDQPGGHNERVQNDQGGAVCPRCGSPAAVHSIQELADLARMRLGQQGTTAAGPGAQQPGWAADPQPMGGPGGQQPGWAADPQPIGPGSPQPGWSANPTPTGGAGNWPRSSGGVPTTPGDALTSLGDDLAGAVGAAAAGAAARFLSRKIGRKVQDRLEQAMSTVAAKQQDTLQQQITIAERHPDLRACLNDQVVFLAGGSHTQPMPNLSTVTVEQADALVAQLRNG